MKKLLLILLCLPFIGFGQLTYVPDDNFEQELINLGYDNILDDYVTTSFINSITDLNVSGLGISDLTGIEDFTSLYSLGISNNQITAIDISNNTNLGNLICNQNQLTSIDLSNNPLIHTLGISDNYITNLDVSDLNYLQVLNCTNNQIVSLDLSNNTELFSLLCSSNQLTSLDVRNGNNTQIQYFNAGDNPNLECISVDDPVWSATFWGGNSASTYYYWTDCPPPSSIQEHTTNKQLLKITDLLGRETKGKKNEPLLYLYDDGTVEKKMIIE